MLKFISSRNQITFSPCQIQFRSDGPEQFLQPTQKDVPQAGPSFLPVEEELKPTPVVTLAVGEVHGGGRANTAVHSQAGAHRVMVLQLPGKPPFSISRAGVLSERCFGNKHLR